MIRFALMLCLCLAPVQAAVVPDGSVVHSEAEAPLLAVPDSPRTPVPHASPRPQGTHKPHAAGTTASPTPTGSSPAGAPAAEGPTFGPAGQTQNPDPTESQPLRPLAPAPVSTSSTAPLLTALFLFVLVAVVGFWLARERSGED